MSEDVRLYHGDCLDLLPTLAAGSVDAVVTDPPYGIATRSDGTSKTAGWGDLCNAACWYTLWLGECRRVLSPSGCLWSCLNWRSLPTFQRAACDLRWPIESLLVWDKDWIGTAGPKQLRPCYELVALWAMPNFCIRDRRARDLVCVPWSACKPNGHPAEKPVDLMRHCVDLSSIPPGGTVLDPFMGSGTVAVACLQTGRRYIGCEIDPAYFAVAEKRLAEASSGGPLFERPAQAALPFADVPK